VVVRALAGEATADRDARERVGLILERPERILPVFQPIVSLTNGRVAGYEALSRFQAAPYEPPNVWFARAKAVGLGFELQALAIHRALRVAMAAGLPADAFLSVNASPGLLADPLLARALSGFPLNRLVIEITEEEAVSDYGILRDGLGWLRAADARIAIDDVGAGYASLRHVTELRPDFVKLDALLTPRFGGDQAARAMARALSGFAEEIGAIMIAEGVERPEDLEVLAGTRLPIMVQGYAIARPGAPWPSILPAASEVWAPAGAGRRRATIDGRPGVRATQV
jgi:EAL domain-containing protein (putative c-di-GMP-specific phosphodiesterase class I)